MIHEAEDPKKALRALQRHQLGSIYSRLLFILQYNPNLSISGHVKNHQRYCYANATDLKLTVEGTLGQDDCDWEDDPTIGPLVDSVQQDMEIWAHGFNKMMEKRLYAELEYRQSEEVLSELWDATEVRFDEDGDMIDRRSVNGLPERLGMKYSELSPEAKQHALEKYRDWSVEDNSWSEFLEDDFEEQLEYTGFDRIEINYSLGYGQGDGAVFTADNIDVKKFCDRMIHGKKPEDVFHESARVQAEALVEGILS